MSSFSSLSSLFVMVFSSCYDVRDVGFCPSSLGGGALSWSTLVRIAFCFCRVPDLVFVGQICAAVLVPEVVNLQLMEDIATCCSDPLDQAVLVQSPDLSDGAVEGRGELLRGVPFHTLIVHVVNIPRQLKSDPVDRDA